MTKRFGLVLLIAFTLPLVMPNTASAQTQNKLVFEIKTLKITPADIVNALNGQDEPEIQIVEPTPVPPAPVVTPAAPRSAYTLPPKTTGDARVYMHEPEIRAYICPKLGEKCDIFLAILIGENGTHECTRDNRGTNRNGSVDIGLAQINWSPKSSYTFEQLQDCKFNLDVALSMVARRGFQPWYVYTKGTYKKHMPAVLAMKATLAAQAAEVTAIEETIQTN
jgi:hypothetical protein